MSLATAVSVLFVLATVVRAGFLVAVIRRRNAVDDYVNFGRSSAAFARIHDGDVLVKRTSILSFLLFLAAGVVLAVWSHHVARNSLNLGLQPPARPGWAAAAWFVPFANLIMPWANLTVLVHAARRPDERAKLWRVGIWGTAWAALYVLGLLSFKVRLSSGLSFGTLNDRVNRQALLTIIDLVATVVACILGISVVRRLSARHDEIAAGR